MKFMLSQLLPFNMLVGGESPITISLVINFSVAAIPSPLC
jgi:hypothetical protein